MMPWKRIPYLPLIAVPLLFAIFVLDLLTPLGTAVWALYIAPIAICTWASSVRYPLLAAAAAILLIFVGFYLSPPGISPSLAWLNRFLGVGLLCFTTAVLVRQMRINRSSINARLAAIVDSSDDAIIGKDLNSIITSWNRGAENLFGYTASEIVGTSILRLIPPERRAEEDLILGKIRSGESLKHFQTRRLTKDGRLIDVSVTASPIKNSEGEVIGASKIARDITLQLQSEHELARQNRLYAALSQVNQAIVWSPTRDILFEKICHVLVDQGGFHAVWIGWHDPQTQQIVPVAIAGDENGYIQKIVVYGDDRPEGRGPTGEAFRTGQPYICNAMLDNPITQPWRPELKRRGLQASAAFPFRLKGEVCGVLSVYAAEPQFFQDKEIALLDEAAHDMSFALDNIAKEDARRQAEATLRSEKSFSETMIESMPGVLYFYNSSGGFLRWNRNFETVSGYSSDEIRIMHPLDFFKGDERSLVEERIAQVFAEGESSIEATFLSKQGVEKRMFFTGRRVLFEATMCLVGVGIDVSERRRAEDRLSESERKYRELVEHANSIILRWTAEGRITFLNEFGQKFFGYDADEIVGRHVLDTIVPPTEGSGRDLARLMTDITAAPAAFEQNINENIRRNGERVWIAWTNRIVSDSHGRIVGFLSIGTDITERKRAENALRDAEIRFHTLFEQTPVGVVVIDPATASMIECNEQSARQLGYATDEFCGLSIAQIEAIESKAATREHIEQILCTGRDQFETKHRAKDGTIRDVFVTARLLELGGRTLIHCVFLDITERKLAEGKVRESEARYRTLFEYAPDGIVISTPDGHYIDANTSICQMLGLERDDLIGRHASEILEPTEVANIEPTLQAIRSRSDHHREWRFQRKNGSILPAEVIATTMPDGNILGMIRDITERKEAEAEREKRHQAEAADRIKSAFLATMSHELRTPLNSIIGFTGIILQGLAGPLNAEQSKQLDMVRTSARHLLALVNDVLDISKIEAGQFVVAWEPFDMKRSIDKVVATVAPLAEKKKLKLRVAIAPGIGATLGDERRFEQILFNLFGNAIKFTDRGEIALQADVIDDFRPLGTHGEAAGQLAVRLRVSDTGIGIKPEELATLFQPFRQIDSGLSRNHDGTGLGLAICRRLADLMGGTIDAESRWEQGSTFTVTLPLKGSLKP